MTGLVISDRSKAAVLLFVVFLCVLVVIVVVHCWAFLCFVMFVVFCCVQWILSSIVIEGVGCVAFLWSVTCYCLLRFVCLFVCFFFFFSWCLCYMQVVIGWRATRAGLLI